MRNFKLVVISTSLVTISVSCNPSSFSTPEQVAIFSTPQKGTSTSQPKVAVDETATAAITPTPSVSPTLPPTATKPILSTPIPRSIEPISYENIEHLERLSTLGLGRVTQVGFSPSGDLLALGTINGIYFYTADSYDLVRYVPISGGVNGFSFSPDSQIIVSTSSKGEVIAWNISDGSEFHIFQYQGYRPSANSIFSPDGEFLFVGSSDGVVRMWSVEDGTLVKTFRGFVGRYDEAETSSIAISPGGFYLASIDISSNVHVWAIHSGELLMETPGRCVAFSPTDDSLAVCKQDDQDFRSSIYLYSTESWELAGKLASQDGFMRSLGYSLDGQLLIVNYSSGEIRIWDTNSRRILNTIVAGYRDRFSSFTISHDLKTIVTLTETGQIATHELSGASSRVLSPLHMSAIQAISFSNDGSYLAVADGSSVRVWNLIDGSLVHQFYQVETKDVSFSPDGQLIAVSTFLDGVRIWRTEDWELLSSFAEDEYAKDVEFSPDGEFLAVVTSRNVSLWDVKSGRQIDTFNVMLPYRVAFSPYHKEMLAIGTYLEVYVISYPVMRQIYELPANAYESKDLLFTSDDKLITTGDTSTVVWNLTNGSRIDTYLLPGSSISASSNLVAAPTTYVASDVSLWSYGKPVQMWKLNNNVGRIMNIKFSQRGDLLAVGGNDGLLEIWGIRE